MQQSSGFCRGSTFVIAPLPGRSHLHSMVDVITRPLLGDDSVRLLRVDYAGALRQDRHAHEYTSVSLVLTGHTSEVVGRRSAVAGALTVLVKPAGVEHACMYGRDGARFLSLEIEPRVLAPLTTPTFGLRRWRVVNRPDAAASVLGLFRHAAAGDFDGLGGDAVTEVLAALDGDELPHPGSPPAWLRDVEACIRESPSRPRIRDLAERAGVHPVYLARAFRRHFGRSPTAHAAWLRLRRASEMLLRAPNGRPPGRGRVALDAGFTDPSHMWREFRRTLSVSPAAFAELGRPVDA